MTTILRVKRKHSDSPHGALVFCKRPKLRDSETGLNLFDTCQIKFVGTIRQEEDPTKGLLNVLKKENRPLDLKSYYKTHRPKSTSLQRLAEVKEISAAKRYKVVNFQRDLNVEDFEDKVALIDLEDTASLTTYNESVTNSYAYDVYCAEMEKDNAEYDDECITIYPLYEHDITFEACEESDSNDSYDSDNSNSESNWRNDYPDESSSSSSSDKNDSDPSKSSSSERSIEYSSEDELIKYIVRRKRTKSRSAFFKSAYFKNIGEKLDNDTPLNDKDIDGSSNDEVYEDDDDDEDNFPSLCSKLSIKDVSNDKENT